MLRTWRVPPVISHCAAYLDANGIVAWAPGMGKTLSRCLDGKRKGVQGHVRARKIV